MLKGTTITSLSTIAKLKIIGLGILLLIVLALPLLTCANPVSTPAPTVTLPSTPTPPSTPILTSAPAAFEIADLRINPSEVNPGEGVIINAKVTNIGEVDGIFNAELRINGIAEVVRKVTVPAGATKISSFFVSKNIPGTYKVALGELSGQFVVIEPGTVTQPNNTQDTAPNSNVPSCCQK